MTDHNRVSEIFLRALDLPASERASFLDRECGSDAALRVEIETMLAQDAREEATGELARRVLDAAADSPTVASAALPSNRIGPYHLLQKIGEGGMGEVWLAEQTEPVRRRVAVKIIKAGMDTKQVVARFEAERQALALMDHPTIAKVFDAGETPQGRPYFVMEFIQGVPITEHCDRQRLTNRDRLELFSRVCEGVQHAHQKAVIHRDLKPSNILVCLQDGHAVPKIIDFGVAKATSQRLTEKTMFTELGVLIGTPEYMSPEQAEMTAQDVDTRTDVYSLGVILYELLVGALPFDPKQLRSAGFAEIVRRIREEEPPPPSRRVSTLGDRSTETASHRGVSLPTLQGELRGDLDWIAMKALEKDRSRRYGSPTELAADIERHLRDRPVVAGPPSRVYRARKFVRRNRAGVIAATAGLVVLVAFAVTMAVQARRIAKQRDRAVEAEGRADAINSFLVTDMLGAASPARSQGRELTVKQVLKEASDKVGGAFAGRPQLEVPLRVTLGGIHQGLGSLDEAQSQLDSAERIARSAFGGDDPRTLAAIEARVRLLAARGSRTDAVPLFRDVLEKQRRVLGNRDPATLQTAADLAAALANLWKLDEAEPLLREALDGRRAALGENDRRTILLIVNYGLLLEMMSSPDAERALREGVEKTRKVLGAKDPLLYTALIYLTAPLIDAGRYADALEAAREAAEVASTIYGEHHAKTLDAIATQASTLDHLGRRTDAENLRQRIVEGWRAQPLQSARFDFTADAAEHLMNAGKIAAAESLLRTELEAARPFLGEDDPGTLLLLVDLGGSLRAQGRLPEAEVCFRRVLAGRAKSLGADHGQTLRVKAQLADLLSREGRNDEAEAMAREVWKRAQEVLGNNSDADGQRAMIQYCLGRILLRERRWQEAEGVLREVVAIRKRDTSEVGALALAQLYLGESFLRQAQLTEAEQILTTNLPLVCENFGAGTPARDDAERLLVELFKMKGTPEQARTLWSSACR